MPSDCPIASALESLMRQRTHIAIVRDKEQRVLGMVTLEDIVEELVGDIQDEHDQEMPAVVKTGDRTWRIIAQTNMDKINESLPMRFPLDDDYETLAGLLLKTSDRIPEEGDVIQVGGYEVKILKMYKTSPEEVEATLLLGE